MGNYHWHRVRTYCPFLSHPIIIITYLSIYIRECISVHLASYLLQTAQWKFTRNDFISIRTHKAPPPHVHIPVPVQLQLLFLSEVNRHVSGQWKTSQPVPLSRSPFLSRRAVESGSFASLAPSPVPSICYCLLSAPAATAGLPFVGPTYDTIARQIITVTDTPENRLRTHCLQVHHTPVQVV